MKRTFENVLEEGDQQFLVFTQRFLLDQRQKNMIWVTNDLSLAYAFNMGM